MALSMEADCTFTRPTAYWCDPTDVNCVYLITIATYTTDVNFNFSCNSQFTLLVTPIWSTDVPKQQYPTDLTWRLPNHVPQVRYLQNGTAEYWRFFVWPGLNVSEVYITMTPLSGYGDMTISTNLTTNSSGVFPVTVPDESKWIYITGVNNTFTFSNQTDPAVNYTIYFVTVRAPPLVNMTYTIVAGQNPLNHRRGRFPTRIINGVPAWDSISDYKHGQWRYFVYYLPVDDGIAWTFPRRLSDMNIFINYTPFYYNQNYTAAVYPPFVNNSFAVTQSRLECLAILSCAGWSL